jgi:hypothetical protein
MKKYLSILALTVGISFVAATPAAAQLLVYEGFDYANGYWLGNTNTGGFGWGAGWATGSQVIATNQSGSLSYGGLQTSGGSAVFGNPYGPFAGTQQATRALTSAMGLTNYFSGSGGTLWVSFLYQNWTTDNVGRLGFRQANLGMFAGTTTNANNTTGQNGTETLDVGALNTYTAGVGDYMSLWGAGVGQAAAQQSGFATLRGSSTSPVLVLLRLDFDATSAADTVYAWFNPTIGGAAPSTATAISTNIINVSGLNAIRFAAGNQNASGTNAVMAVDEFRLGYTFGDVTPVPEPMTMALGSLGGLLLLALRRRK